MARGGTAEQAAYIAMDNANFYNVTIKNFATPWTNREGDVFVPLNDYVATVVGMTSLIETLGVPATSCYKP